MGSCESRLLNLMGARSKTFKGGSGHHTSLFENETCRNRLVLDQCVWLLPLSDFVYFSTTKELSLSIDTGTLVLDVDSAL